MNSELAEAYEKAHEVTSVILNELGELIGPMLEPSDETLEESEVLDVMFEWVRNNENKTLGLLIALGTMVAMERKIKGGSDDN